MMAINITETMWNHLEGQIVQSTFGPTTDASPAHTDMRIYEGLFLICICIFAFSGNTLLCTIILRTRSLRNNSNYLILCLSTSDIIVAVVNMPMTIYAIFYGKWPFSTTSCVVLGYINMVSFIASVMSLTAISINRYFRICRSLQFKSMFTFRKTILMAFIVWIVSLLLAAPPLAGWGEYRFLKNQSFCFCDWTLSDSYTFFMIGICFCVPCLVMSFCYVRIIKSVRKSNRRLMSLDQRLSASFADMESDNPQSDLPSVNSQMMTTPQKLKAINANGTRIVVDPLCARKLTDYAKTLKQSIELQKRGVKNSSNAKDLGEENLNEPELRLPIDGNPVPYTITIKDFNFSVSPESESCDNLDSTTQNLSNGSLKNLNNSYDTILSLSSPENQSQDDIDSDRGENGHLCVHYGNDKSSSDDGQQSRKISPSTVDSVFSQSSQRKLSELSSETENQNNNSVRSSDEMLEKESPTESGDDSGNGEADEDRDEREPAVEEETRLERMTSKEMESSSKMDEETLPCSLCGRILDRDVPCGCWVRRTAREKSRTFPTCKMPMVPCRNKRITVSDSSRHRKHKKSPGGKRSMKKTFSLSQVKFSGTGRKSNNSVPSRYLRRRREEIRITFSLLVVIIVFFVSWLPFCITMLCSLYCDGPVPRSADIISLFFGYANSCFNPLIYGLMNRRFSDAYKQLFKSMFYGKCIKR